MGIVNSVRRKICFCLPAPNTEETKLPVMTDGHSKVQVQKVPNATSAPDESIKQSGIRRAPHPSENAQQQAAGAEQSAKDGAATDTPGPQSAGDGATSGSAARGLGEGTTQSAGGADAAGTEGEKSYFAQATDAVTGTMQSAKETVVGATTRGTDMPVMVGNGQVEMRHVKPNGETSTAKSAPSEEKTYTQQATDAATGAANAAATTAGSAVGALRNATGL